MRVHARPLALLLGGATLAGVVRAPDVAPVITTVTVLFLAGFVLQARRAEVLLRGTRTWLLLALAMGTLSGVLAVFEQLVAPDAPAYPAPSDLVGLLYIPFTLAGLVWVPLKSLRRGFRARALSDGLIAASSLWYLLVPAMDSVTAQHDTPLATGVAIAFPLGDAFIVAAALTTLARCTDEARPLVLWIALGLSCIATSDVGFAIAPDGAAGVRSGVFQLGLLALVGAAVRRRPPTRVRRVSLDEVPYALGVLPFLPFMGCVVYSTHLVLQGNGLDARQLTVAVAVALALVTRQYVGSRDKVRLVDELATREARLQRELRIDRLTGAANRLGIEEALGDALRKVEHTFVLAVLDLDDFKLINDNHGHAVGDEVLRVVAHRLQACVRRGDVVARLGGDEFALLLQGGLPETDVLSERILAALQQPAVVDERRFRLSGSIGVVGNDPEDSVERLLADADGAMYQAKADRSSSSIVRLDREGRLRVALQSRIKEQVATPRLEQFQVHYQPLVDLATGRIRGLEALLRWNHPQFGSVPPDVFIPLAEQCGTIQVLGDFVLTTAVRDLATVAAVDPANRYAVGVNVSPRQLVSADFADSALRLLAEERLNPDQLVLEITEQAFEADLGPIRQTVSALMASGISVAVDDFGTGYSSLRYLQHLELDVLKIDRSFVAGAGTSDRQQRLIEGITALARHMDLQIIAEGIETVEQLTYMRASGCELGQGYLFGRPAPLAEVIELVRRGQGFPVTAVTAVPSPRLPGKLVAGG